MCDTTIYPAKFPALFCERWQQRRRRRKWDDDDYDYEDDDDLKITALTAACIVEIIPSEVFDAAIYLHLRYIPCIQG
jgi:hypothetical protein